MRRIIYTLLISAGLGYSGIGYAQINTGGSPYTFTHAVSTRSDLKLMPSINLNQLEAEDEADARAGLPPRFGKTFPVDYDLVNAGTWTTLDNGDQLWQLTIHSPGALTINLIYDDFWLPEGATLYLYNNDQSHVIGGFTSKNNKGLRTDTTGFATGLVRGDKITLEYLEPQAAAGQGQIAISRIVHGYRLPGPIKGVSGRAFEDSGNCQVNINCAEGDEWQFEKQAIAMIVVDGNRWCTGSLLNTYAEEYVPYFLTADHCLDGWAIDTPLDAVTNNDASDWVFYFNYESPNCANPASDPLDDADSFSSAILVSNLDDSDFALMRILENPRSINPVYLGWTTTSPGQGGVGIHHPRGDVMKIATHSQTPTNSDNDGFSPANSHWQVFWDQTANGQSVTEGGSSGSPLFDQNSRVVGQLHGGGSGNPNCTDPDNDDAFYGRLNMSWNGNGSADRRRRLQNWIGQACDTYLTENTNYWGDEPVKRAYGIDATNTVGSNAYVRYEGTGYVDLEPGFDARPGSDFMASIGSGCSPSLREPVNNGHTANTRLSDGTEIIKEVPEAIHFASQAEESPSPTSVKTQMLEFSVAPNPMASRAQIEWSLPEAQQVRLRVLNTYGQQIQLLVDARSYPAGTHRIDFEAGHLPAGVYYFVLQTATNTITRSATVVKP